MKPMKKAPITTVPKEAQKMSSAARNMVDKSAYMQHDIDSIYALVQHMADKLQPPIQKSMKLEKIKTKAQKTKESFISLFGSYTDKDTRKAVKNIGNGFDAIYNHAQSILDMMGSGTLDGKEMNYFIEKQEFRCHKLKGLISSLTTEKVDQMPKVENSDAEVNENTEASDDMKIVATKPKDENEEMDENGDGRLTMDEILKKSEQQLRHYDTFKGKLPDAKTDKRPFVIFRMPVIPVQMTLTAKDFADVGFVVDKVGRYSVLKNQLVIGLNINVKNFSDAEFKELLEAVNSRGTNYQVVGKVHPKKGYNWYWLVPEYTLKQLDNMNKRLTLKNGEWGLAFNA